jgi:two-component system, NtrC family, nitrogen regulation sensor histidine kinase NtrY
MYKRILNSLKKYSLLLAGLLALLLSVSWEPLFFSGSDQKAEGERISRVFEAKERLIGIEMERLAALLNSGKPGLAIWQATENSELGKSGLFFTVSTADSLVFWSSSLVAFDGKALRLKPDGVLNKMPTGWFYVFSKQSGKYSINGFMLIKRDFPYQNRYVQSAFQQDFRLADQCEVVPVQKPGNIRVVDHSGKFRFGIQFREMLSKSAQEEIPVMLFFLLFVVLFLLHVNRQIDRLNLKPYLKFVLTLLFVGSFYLLLNHFRFPADVYSNQLFDPVHFAWGKLLPSLGDFFLLSLFLFFLAQSFFVVFRKQRIRHPFSIGNIILYLFASGYFIFSFRLFLILLNNSDISLELYRSFTLSIPNILASGCIAMQMIGLGVILVRIRCTAKTGKKYFSFFALTLYTLVLMLLVLVPFGIKISYTAAFVYFILVLLIDRTGLDLLAKYKLTVLLGYGLLMAFGLNLVAQGEIAGKRAGIQKVMAVNLATERDPAAETFLSDFKMKVGKDSVISTFLIPPYHYFENYLKENYFTGFWNNYELQVTFCAANDSVFLPDERRRFPCLDFFSQLEVSKGVLLPGSDFYFMDRLNGRISYLGELHLFDFKNHKPLVVFIELNSKIVPEGKGYPQLLMDQQAAKMNRNEGYSYAKYFDKKLVDRGGSYLYETSIPAEVNFNREFTYFEKEGYSHCVYKRSGENYVVVSFPVVSWVEKGGGFPPLFLLIYLFGFAWIVLNQRMKLIPVNRLELRGKIQFTLVSTLLVSLFLIGLGLIEYNYREFQRSMKENLDQKVRAISAELGFRIGNAVRLDSIHDFLGDQLEEISDIAWTDINVYNLKGKLVASSRDEVFEQGLTSERMNPQAFRAMSIQGGVTFLHNENLGKMEFFSVYAPFFNRSDELVGYVNLPYFNRQDDFTRQVSGFIVAFINLYILLVLLTMVIALFISTKLTVPLLQIEQKLKGIALGKENATIEYLGEDEIGRLVEAYNKKVAELAESVDLLARSERESAWKEMARQIAHEINNPLTPMKLNIQYLQKIKDEGTPNFDDYFNRVTRMLVVQIDALSTIASTFSDFARLPSSHVEPVEMVGLVREVATLFDAPEAYILTVDCPEERQFVSGDRDQLRRALVNIIRNATQALQNQVGGTILVRLDVLDRKLRVAVIDNGSGIPKADCDRLFEPNFTTRSGGMGLGLAITKSILENYKGEISFESEPGKTTFFLDFPIGGREG